MGLTLISSSDQPSPGDEKLGFGQQAFTKIKLKKELLVSPGGER